MTCYTVTVIKDILEDETETVIDKTAPRLPAPELPLFYLHKSLTIKFIRIQPQTTESNMALNTHAVAGKMHQTKDGTKYAYVYVPAKKAKPTFLLLHGFPSSSYDWRHQIKPLADLEFGVLAPDLLGYGDTDRPIELEKYKFKNMALDIVQILDEESLKTVIGVGHDWYFFQIFSTVQIFCPSFQPISLVTF